MHQLNDLSPGELRLTCATLQDEVARLGEALKDAAQSLETISQNAGTNEYMKELSEVRGYAGSRASVARVALIHNRSRPQPPSSEPGVTDHGPTL